jgi:hypothetical protein
MNTERIQEAIDILTTFAAAQVIEATSTMSMDLTKREAEVFRDICLTDVGIPDAVTTYSPTTRKSEVRNLLSRIKYALHCAK